MASSCATVAGERSKELEAATECVWGVLLGLPPGATISTVGGGGG